MRLYNDLAWLWPIVSPPAEYIVEAQEWLDLIRSRRNLWQDGRRPTLLELGCGGGHFLSQLTPHFDAAAVDLAPQMLELSRALNPYTPHHQGDMRTVRLGMSFDVAVIYDSVNYMLTESDLAAAIATGAAHLKPGGLLLLAPDWLRDDFHGPRVIEWSREWSREADDRSVTFIEYVADPDPTDTTIESVFFFIINRDGQITVEQDRHTGGLFPRSVWLSMLDRAGFDAEYLRTQDYEGGFGGNLFIGTLREDAETPVSPLPVLAIPVAPIRG